MIKNIKLIEKDFYKSGSTWKEEKTQISTVDETFYNNCVKDKNPFGYERKTSNYTKFGYRVIKISSISPCKDLKHIWEFDFDESEQVF